MITMKEFMELVDYKITEGNDYGWACYGNHAYSLDSWNGVHGDGGYSFTIVFSTKSQRVFEVCVHDYTNDRAYRMIAENKQEKHRLEAKQRDVNLNQAWELDDGTSIEYVDLELVEDFMEKAQAIKEGKTYDTGVLVPLNLSDEMLLQAALEAHKRNITLNAYVNLALADLVERVKNGEISKQDFIKSEDC